MLISSRVSPFQSTLPVGGATTVRESTPNNRRISIHAPRGGSDTQTALLAAVAADFNPRSPWGERLPRAHICGKTPQFQSTLPVGGATIGGNISAARLQISIHAPRGGSDTGRPAAAGQPGDFNPRSPWGERLSIRRSYRNSVLDFNPRSPWGERPYPACRRCWRPYFNPRSPWGERLRQAGYHSRQF